MKQERNYPRAVITSKGQKFIEDGHIWVYDAEIISGLENVENGALCDVVGQNNKYLGTGFYSESSKIRIRIISRNTNDVFDSAFWERRVSYAWEYRKTVMSGDTDACRVIFGEADGFPGLTVDKFGDILVTQTLSYGMEIRKDIIFPLLVSVIGADCPILGIYERNDVAIRALEKLQEGKGWYEYGVPHPDNTCTDIVENGIRYTVDFENGQKTGFFLDQKYNRAAVARIAKGKTVLDCFTHTGSFALNAAAAGAAHVTAVDVSKLAVAASEHHAEVNGLDGVMDFICEDVFTLLDRLEAEKSRKYDLIILDPPAFTKSRKTVQAAAGGYRDINYKAMKILPRGGYLATCSCSHFMPPELFTEQLTAVAKAAGRELKLVEYRRQSPDHPVILGIPETDYLKFYIFQVI